MIGFSLGGLRAQHDSFVIIRIRFLYETCHTLLILLWSSVRLL